MGPRFRQGDDRKAGLILRPAWAYGVSPAFWIWFLGCGFEFYLELGGWKFQLIHLVRPVEFPRFNFQISSSPQIQNIKPQKPASRAEFGNKDSPGGCMGVPIH